jgi:hypothetical protein
VVIGWPGKNGCDRSHDQFTCPPGKVGAFVLHGLTVNALTSTTYSVDALSTSPVIVALVSADVVPPARSAGSAAGRTTTEYTLAPDTAGHDTLTELVVLDPEIAVVVGKNLVASTSTATLYNFPSTVASTVYVPDTARH